LAKTTPPDTAATGGTKLDKGLVKNKQNFTGGTQGVAAVLRSQ